MKSLHIIPNNRTSHNSSNYHCYNSIIVIVIVTDAITITSSG